MSDDPRDTTAAPGRPPDAPSRPGAGVQTAPAGPPRPVVPPHPESPEPAPEPDVQVDLVEEERRDQVDAPPSPPVEPASVEPAPVPPDEAATVELAVSDLHEAARAAGVELQPNVDQPETDEPGSDVEPGTEIEPGDPALDELEPGTGPIDPRIRERRIAVTRAQGRRRLRILLVAVAVASTLGIAWLIVMSPLLALDDVTIQGTLHESPESVRAAMGIDDGSALMFVDTDRRRPPGRAAAVGPGGDRRSRAAERAGGHRGRAHARGLGAPPVTARCAARAGGCGGHRRRDRSRARRRADAAGGVAGDQGDPEARRAGEPDRTGPSRARTRTASRPHCGRRWTSSPARTASRC